MAYDPTSGRVIMFGGFDDFGVRLNDTWAYDPVANTWTDLSPQGTLPPARSAQAMAYDPSSGRVIMFGGLSGSPNPSSSLEGLDDTWAYDPVANTWTNLSPSGPRPPASWWQSMVFDPVEWAADHVREDWQALT